jgi:hypothetical protein
MSAGGFVRRPQAPDKCCKQWLRHGTMLCMVRLAVPAGAYDKLVKHSWPDVLRNNGVLDNMQL